MLKRNLITIIVYKIQFLYWYRNNSKICAVNYFYGKKLKKFYKQTNLTLAGILVGVCSVKVCTKRKTASTPRPRLKNGTIWVVEALKVMPAKAAIPRPAAILTPTRITPAIPSPAWDRTLSVQLYSVIPA